LLHPPVHPSVKRKVNQRDNDTYYRIKDNHENEQHHIAETVRSDGPPHGVQVERFAQDVSVTLETEAKQEPND
jgi:hypothetical protein